MGRQKKGGAWGGHGLTPRLKEVTVFQVCGNNTRSDSSVRSGVYDEHLIKPLHRHSSAATSWASSPPCFCFDCSPRPVGLCGIRKKKKPTGRCRVGEGHEWGDLRTPWAVSDQQKPALKRARCSSCRGISGWSHCSRTPSGMDEQMNDAEPGSAA